MDTFNETPFAVLEDILRKETGKETVLYGFKGYRSTPVVYAFTEGAVSAPDTAVHLRMSFDDDPGGVYLLFRLNNIPTFFQKIEMKPTGGYFVESVSESNLGRGRDAKWGYEYWQDIQRRKFPEEQPLAPTPQTAYLHCWDGTLLRSQCNPPVGPYANLAFYVADSMEFRRYLAEFEAKIPGHYVLSIPGVKYELNTNMKRSDCIDSQINLDVGRGSAGRVIEEFEKQTKEIARQISLLKPHHQAMEAFVLGAQRAYDQAREEHLSRKQAQRGA